MKVQGLKFVVVAAPLVLNAFSMVGCSSGSSVADAPEQPAPELSKAERDAEAAYARTTRK